VTVNSAGTCPVQGFTGGNSFPFTQQVGADGAVTTFAIPPKKIFVITDITVSASNEPAGDSVITTIAVGSASAGGVIAGRFDTVESSGNKTVSFEFPAGVAVKSGATICSQVLNLTHGGFVGSSATAHGFFAPDK
jgi:hypothetical protein